MHSQLETKENWLNLWLEHIAQNRQIYKQQEVESQRRFSLTLMDRRPGLSTRSLIDDWLDLTVLEAEKRGPALKNRLVGDAKLHKGLLNRESLRAADGIKYFRDTLTPHFIKRSSECVPLEILSIHSSEKRTCRDGQVDWKFFIAVETLERFLDGHVADVRPDRRAKTKPISC